MQSILVTSAIDIGLLNTVQHILNKDDAESSVNQVFFFNQALASLPTLSARELDALNQFTDANNPLIGYCTSVTERRGIVHPILDQWQGFGLTEFYARLHDALKIRQL